NPYAALFFVWEFVGITSPHRQRPIGLVFAYSPACSSDSSTLRGIFLFRHNSSGANLRGVKPNTRRAHHVCGELSSGEHRVDHGRRAIGAESDSLPQNLR